jgi:hypothetical protein
MATAALFLDYRVGDGRIVVTAPRLRPAEDEYREAEGEQAEGQWAIWDIYGGFLLLMCAICVYWLNMKLNQSPFS